MDKVDIFVIVAAVFVFAFMALIIILATTETQKEMGIKNDEFDERQKNIRSKGFAIGFWVLLGYYVILAILKECRIFNFENRIIELLFAVFISFAVVMIYLIWHDADIKPKQEKVSPDTLYVITTILGIIWLIGGIIGTLSNFDQFAIIVPIMGGIFFIFVSVNHFAKNAWDKKHKKISDDDEE